MNYFNLFVIIFVALIYYSNGISIDTCKIKKFGEIQLFNQKIEFFKFKKCYSIVASNECTFNKNGERALFTVLIRKFPNLDTNAIKLITKDEIIDIEPLGPDSGVLADFEVKINNQRVPYNSNDLGYNTINNLCTIKFLNNFSAVEIENRDVLLNYKGGNLKIQDKNLIQKCGICAGSNNSQLLPYQYSLLFNSLIDEDCITENNKNSTINKHKMSYIDPLNLKPIIEYNNTICLSEDNISSCNYQTEPIYLSNSKNNSVNTIFYCINKTDDKSDKLTNLQSRQISLINAHNNILAYIKKTNVLGTFVTRLNEFNKVIETIKTELIEIDLAIGSMYADFRTSALSYKKIKKNYLIPELCKFISESLILKN